MRSFQSKRRKRFVFRDFSKIQIVRESDPTMQPVKRQRSARQCEAGARNLRTYRERVGGKPALKSAIYSFFANGEIPAQTPCGGELAAAVDRLMERIRPVGAGTESEVSDVQREIFRDLRISVTAVALGWGLYYRKFQSDIGTDGDDDKARRLTALVERFKARALRSLAKLGKADGADKLLLGLACEVHEVIGNIQAKKTCDPGAPEVLPA